MTPDDLGDPPNPRAARTPTGPAAAPHPDPPDTTLDPSDWDAYRADLHALVDACVDQLEGIRDRPWRAFPDADADAVALGNAERGHGLPATIRALRDRVLRHHGGNVHPRFYGWVQGTGNPAALAADVVASTMNANVGGRDHAAVHVERDVLAWTKTALGFPADASGVLVTGTSQATVVALAVARDRALARHGDAARDRLRLYAADGAHVAVAKAARLLGLHDAQFVRLPADAAGRLDPAALAATLRDDRAAGAVPMAVVASAGSVDVGAVDDLDALADLAAREDVWLHVDGAFGAWLALAGPPYDALVRGLGRADSLATDFHKWMAVQYDVAVALVRDADAHRATFAANTAYLRTEGEGIAGGQPWFADYGTDLSRGFRALKVWATLFAYGRDALGATIRHNCDLARRMEARVAATPGLAVAHPVASNVCTFRLDPAALGAPALDADAEARLVTTVVHAAQRSDDAILSTTRVGGRRAFRAAIVNHRATEADVDATVDALAAHVARALT
jgi:glutamate/tyrosine decarboxylase-like PLP-dependent enzyme